LTARKSLDDFLSELSSLCALNHRCVCDAVAVSPPARSSQSILTLDCASRTTLADVFSDPRQEWWTVIGKGIVLIGIVFALIHADDRGTFTEISILIVVSWMKAIDPSYATLESKESGRKLRPRRKPNEKSGCSRIFTDSL
jgi:hypothetical protein